MWVLFEVHILKSRMQLLSHQIDNINDSWGENERKDAAFTQQIEYSLGVTWFFFSFKKIICMKVGTVPNVLLNKFSMALLWVYFIQS